MDKLKTYVIKKEKYYKADDLMEMKGFTGYKNTRAIVENLKLKKDTQYIYAKQGNKPSKWIIASGNSFKFDKVFVSESWVKKFTRKKTDEESTNEESTNEESSNEESSNEESSDNKSNCDKEIKLDKKILESPGIIKLKKSEMIKDDNGKRINVEIVGTRQHNNCFFKVSDVSRGFRMKNLKNSLTNKSTHYEFRLHYVYFYSASESLTGRTKNKKSKNRRYQTYLTYQGLLKVLFTSRNNIVENFVAWAVETLFTAHLGTSEAKQKLSSKLLGVPTEVVKEVFNKTNSKLPVIYLFAIGKVKDLRVTLNIGKEFNDEDIVYKGGKSDNLSKRITKHESEYGKMPGANLCLKWYNYIDPQYTYDAETELLKIMGKMGYKFTHVKYRELLIFPKKETKIVTDQFSSIANKYIGHIKEMSDKLTEEKHKTRSLEKDKEMLEKGKEMLEMKIELQLIKKDNEIKSLTKDVKTLRIKLSKKYD